MQARHGPVFRTRSFAAAAGHADRPGCERAGAVRPRQAVLSEQGWARCSILLFPRGLMLMDFAGHRADRRALSIAFKPEPMRHYWRSAQQRYRPRGGRLGRRRAPVRPGNQGADMETAATSFLGLAVRAARRTGSTRRSSIWRRPPLHRFAARLPFTAMGKAWPAAS